MSTNCRYIHEKNTFGTLFVGEVFFTLSINADNAKRPGDVLTMASRRREIPRTALFESTDAKRDFEILIPVFLVLVVERDSRVLDLR